ncbi:MAG: hypothetical protein IJX72_01570, partial [Clostridia bacterium]|nr:hypothetical protein [Clostridia bacterium]
MRSLLQKLLALALAALMLFPLAACGAGEQIPDETEGATTDAQTEVETVDPNYALDLPETLQYDTEVNILYVNSDGRSDELENAGLEGGVISDAVYERNLAVEERLGIQFGYSHEDEDTDLFPVIAKLVKSGDTSI